MDELLVRPPGMPEGASDRMIVQPALGGEDTDQSAGRQNPELPPDSHTVARIAALQQQLDALESERQQLLHRLQEAQGQVGELERLAQLGLLMSGVAHEINNLLTGAIGFTYLLGRHLNGSEGVERPERPERPERKMLSSVSTELHRCAALTRGLVQYARSVRFNRQAIALGPLVLRVVDGMGGRFEQRGIRLDLEVSTEACLVLGVLSQLETMTRGLLLSAIDRVSPGRSAAGGSGSDLRLSLDAERMDGLRQEGRSGHGMFPGRGTDPGLQATKSVTKKRDAEQLADGAPWVRLRLEKNAGVVLLEVADSSGGGEAPTVWEPLMQSVPGEAPFGLLIAKAVVKEHGGKMELGRDEIGLVCGLRFPRLQE